MILCLLLKKMRTFARLYVEFMIGKIIKDGIKGFDSRMYCIRFQGDA